MLREQCKVGMVVLFGRRHGEKTRGKITKVNLKTASVETLEERGRNHKPGGKWKVPFSLMESLTEYANVPGSNNEDRNGRLPPRPKDKDEDYHICVAITSCYAEKLGASPKKCGDLERKLKFLFLALGRKLSAQEARDYLEEV